ncbi:MAG: LLM class flavin-dependent oxidoreductase [Mesorhizobium sp.]|nr:LLM class flavin-dependent oxidoreductase [Mesorhizobium sp.]
MVQLSILDIIPVPEGSTPGDALRRAANLAVAAEGWGYNRYWIAEHHNMVGAAGAATAVNVCHIAGATRRIRVGAGGIMLPNHPPLIVAEQFGTLESLYPGRIDLGLGRAPGTDHMTARAMRRNTGRAQEFPFEVQELQGYFQPDDGAARVRAIPGTGLRVPLWILGSSPSSGALAGAMGLPYAFASHFAPDGLMEGLATYRSSFAPSEVLSAPYVMLGVNVILADTQREAERMFTSIQQRYLNIVRGTPGKLPAPVDDINSLWTASEARQVSHMLHYSFVGTVESVGPQLSRFIDQTAADELIVSATLYDAAARLRSYELLAKLGQAGPVSQAYA